MTKKSLSRVLAAVLSVGMLFSCGCSMPTKKKDVTLIIKTPVLDIYSMTRPDIDSAEDFMREAGKAFAASYDKANVSIQLEVYQYTNIKEAITDTFDTDDSPDVLYEDYHNMSSFIHTGRVIPLDDIITEEFRNDVDDVMWDMSKVNDKTYMIPHLSRQNILVYNRELFREAGLTEYADAEQGLQNWSMDEWEKILDTLAQNLPENAYPIMMYAGDHQGDMHIMSFIRAFGCPIFQEDGTFCLESEEGIKSLQWLQDGVERGWYPPHSENITILDNMELFLSEQLAIMMFNNTTILMMDSLDNYGFVNFPGNIATSFVTGFEVIDNGDDSKLQVAKDFVSYICESEEWMEISAGNLPVSKKVTEKYANQIPMLEDFANNIPNVVNFTNNSPNWQGKEDSVRSVFYPHIHDLIGETVTPEECAKEIDKDCNAAIAIETSLHE